MTNVANKAEDENQNDSMVALKDSLNGYLSSGIHEVNGWCIPHLWQMIPAAPVFDSRGIPLGSSL